jgi:hypothetical protein
MSINSFRINRMDIQCLFGYSVHLCNVCCKTSIGSKAGATTYTVAFETSI